MDWKIYLILGAIGLLITFLRLKSADDKANENKAEFDQKQDETRKQTEKIIADENIKVQAKFVSSDTSVILDGENLSVIVLQRKNVGLSRNSYPMTDISGIRMIDRSEDWKYCQEMQRLYSGVERHSRYKPYGDHSTKEVKNGHQRFESYEGEEVLGIEITLKSQPETPIDISCWNADGAVFWKQETLYQELKEFAIKAEEMRKRASW